MPLDRSGAEMSGRGNVLPIFIPASAVGVKRQSDDNFWDGGLNKPCFWGDFVGGETLFCFGGVVGARPSRRCRRSHGNLKELLREC